MSNQRCHGTTGRIVVEDFEKEKPLLKALPAQRFPATLAEQRKISRDGMVSYQGNLYSVPDGVRSRTVTIQAQAFDLRILDHDEVVARHQIVHGKGNRVMDPSHRKVSTETLGSSDSQMLDQGVAQRPLEQYALVVRYRSATRIWSPLMFSDSVTISGPVKMAAFVTLR